MVEIIVETFWNHGEPSTSEIRVRPLPGQLAEDYRVWCSKLRRGDRPVPSLFKVVVSWVRPVTRAAYLRIDPNQEWAAVTPLDAAEFIAARFGTRRLSHSVSGRGDHIGRGR